MIINNLKIHTMDKKSTVIENGYIEFDGGKIIAVGRGKGGRNAVDGAGAYLFPGFIDAHTHIGIVEDSLTFEGDDTNEMTDPVTPQLRAVDAINPCDKCFCEAAAGGITAVAAGPGSANVIGGQFCVIKTHGKRIDNMTVLSPAAMKFALGENPKGVYHGKNQAPETRMATAALIREALYKAKRYRDDLKRAGKDDEDKPDYDIKCEALLPVISGKLPAHFHAHRADDIFTAIRIANEFKLKYTIIHCTEGQYITDELVREGTNAVVGPNLVDRSKPELREQSFKNPGVMAKAGIKIALTTDHPVIPVQYLPLCAALSVRDGLDENEALRAMTINPAEILGISKRVGSLEKGKDADFALWSGSPLDVMSKPRAVFIDGECVFGEVK